LDCTDTDGSVKFLTTVILLQLVGDALNVTSKMKGWGSHVGVVSLMPSMQYMRTYQLVKTPSHIDYSWTETYELQVYQDAMLIDI